MRNQDIIVCVPMCARVYICLCRPEVTSGVTPQAHPTFYAETVSFTVLKVANDALLAREPWAPSLSVCSVLGSNAHHHTQLFYMGSGEQTQVLMFVRNSPFRMSHLPSPKTQLPKPLSSFQEPRPVLQPLPLDLPSHTGTLLPYVFCFINTQAKFVSVSPNHPVMKLLTVVTDMFCDVSAVTGMTLLYFIGPK